VDKQWTSSGQGSEAQAVDKQWTSSGQGSGQAVDKAVRHKQAFLHALLEYNE